MMLDLIAFDADDTLWHNEPLYQETEDKFKRLLSGYADEEFVSRQLLATERRNLQVYGYGIKSFTLSMIETAIELSAGEIACSEISKIIDFAKQMLTAEVQLLEHAVNTVRTLTKDHRLMVITKGDLRDQAYKLARSGLKACFRFIEIVTEKDEQTYEDILGKYELRPDRFLMVGNSIKSDVLPVLAVGGHAVYIPYHVTWAHERVPDEPVEHAAYHKLENLGQLPELISQLAQA